MLKETSVKFSWDEFNDVLILILMEHAQRVVMDAMLFTMTGVLIFILMEHAQRGFVQVWISPA